MNFTFGTPTNWANNAHQGITTDGTYVYTTSNTTLYKYNKSGGIQTSHDCSSDGTYGSYLGDLCYKDNKLYIASHNSGSPWHGKILVYNISDLSYVEEIDIADAEYNDSASIAGVSWDGTNFWLIFDTTVENADSEIRKCNSSFGKVATYSLTYNIDNDWHYQGCDWCGDYLFCNIHEVGSNTTCDVYLWNGSGFTEIERIEQLTYCTQGLAIENDNGTYYIWWSSRPSDTVYKTALIINAPIITTQIVDTIEKTTAMGHGTIVS